VPWSSGTSVTATTSSARRACTTSPSTQRRYAEQDAKFTWLLWKRYERILRHEASSICSSSRCRSWRCDAEEYAGAYVDSKAMEVHARRTRSASDTISRLLSEHSVPPTFNPDNLHKADLLFTRLQAPVLKTGRQGVGRC
jgi:hypothetical protein